MLVIDPIIENLTTRVDAGTAQGDRPLRSAAFPVVDLFAGPGGLGEGFALSTDEKGRPSFNSVVSIERDVFSHQTLLLRHFIRQFPEGEAPDDYYAFLAGGITRDELYIRHPTAYRHAASSALRISLGPDSHADVKKIIQNRIGRSRRWGLVGGPPCQAYSLVGRSRMMGRENFAADGEGDQPARFVEPARADEALGRIVPVGKQARTVPADETLVGPHLRLVAQIVLKARYDEDQPVACIRRLADKLCVVGRLARQDVSAHSAGKC